MAGEEPESSEDSGLDEFADIDILFGQDCPVERIDLCPFCQKPVDGSGFWVLENREDFGYTGYCNQLHHDAHHRIGLWAESDPPALPL